MALILAFVECDEGQNLTDLKSEIYGRLGPKFYDRCKKVGSKLYRGLPYLEQQVDEIFQDSFLIAFEVLKNFKINPDWDDATCERVLLGWLGKIGNNFFLDAARCWKKEKSWTKSLNTEDILSYSSADFFNRTNPNLTYDKAKFEKFWAQQSEMTRDILLCCIEHGTIRDEARTFISDKETELQKLKNDMGNSSKTKEVQKFINAGLNDKNTEHLPDHVMHGLMERYNVTPSAIRKAKERGLKGLRKCKF